MLSRLPDLQARFALSEGQLGILLVSMSSGVLFGLTFSVTAAGPTCEQCLARCDLMRASCTTADCLYRAKMCAIRDCRSACIT